MTSLRIQPDTRGVHRLISSQPVGYGTTRLMLLEAFIPFGSFTTRPDPIRRAWIAVEAKRGFRDLEDVPARPASCRQEPRNEPSAPVYTPANPRKAARAENRSQGWFGRLVGMLRGVR